MKFSQVSRGIRVERPVAIPVGRDAEGKVIEVQAILRPLSAEEERDVIADAMRDAKAKGLADPTDGHDLYDIAMWAHTLVRSCLDADSPAEKRQPFFANVAEILCPDGLHQDAIAQVYYQQRDLQDEVSPSFHAKSIEDLVRITAQIGKGGADALGPFVGSSWGTQSVLVRFMASRLVNSPDFKSLVTSLDSPSGIDTSSESPEPNDDVAEGA